MSSNYHGNGTGNPATFIKRKSKWHSYGYIYYLYHRSTGLTNLLLVILHQSSQPLLNITLHYMHLWVLGLRKRWVKGVMATGEAHVSTWLCLWLVGAILIPMVQEVYRCSVSPVCWDKSWAPSLSPSSVRSFSLACMPSPVPSCSLDISVELLNFILDALWGAWGFCCGCHAFGKGVH